LFLFCNWWSKEVLLLRSAQCSKKIGDGQTNMAPSKNKNWKEKCEDTHELIKYESQNGLLGRVLFARGISPGQKWWWTLSWEKFHTANGKAQACTQGALLFKKRFGWRGGFFFHSSLSYQCVPTTFPLSSQWVPIRFPIFSLSSQCVLHNTSLQKTARFFWY
jgi:hypothetical protein